MHTALSSRDHDVTVGAVALQRGFAHLERFSAQYRSRLGKLLNETLARRPLRMMCRQSRSRQVRSLL